MAFNFGYEHRAGWFMNWRFVILSIGFSIIQFYIALVPSKLSCLFRVNCVNDDVVRQVTTGGGDNLVPLQTPYANTILPVEFRWVIASLMFTNLIAIMVWEYYVVNGFMMRIMHNRKGNHGLGEQAVLFEKPSEFLNS